MNRLAHPIPAEWLTAYYDGELDMARQDQVEAHCRTGSQRSRSWRK
jgi:hypothetical protein